MTKFGEIYDGPLDDDVPAALGRVLAASVGDDLAELEARITGEFRGFEVKAFFGKPTLKGMSFGWGSFHGVQLPALLEVLAWMRARGVPLVVRLDLSSSPLDRPARVAVVQQLLPGSRPVGVRRVCYPPTSERGEEPIGNFGVSLVVRQSSGDEVTVNFSSGLYGESQAAQVKAAVESEAAALAALVGVDVTKGEQ
jgi:hypothetical protein